MSPGVNDGSHNTGTLPKSNRRSDRNRERSAANQQVTTRSTYRSDFFQHPNNLLQLDWQPVSEREPRRSAKNSNTRSTSSAPSITYHDFSDFGLEGSSRQYKYTSEECSPWQRMAPPADSCTQSPPHLQGTKPTNIDKMPDRGLVESRLNQIRHYISMTSTMMDHLSQFTDPRVQAQHEKLSRMVTDLYDSESKLTKLLEDYHNHGTFDENGESRGEEIEENGDGNREAQLRKKMEESQWKLAQLQELQANLVGMQLRAKERIKEARQAQQALLLQENQASTSTPIWEGSNCLSQQAQTNAEQLESETAALRGQLAQLQNKKKQIDHLVTALQAAETSDRGSYNEENRKQEVEENSDGGRDAQLPGKMEEWQRKLTQLQEHEANLVGMQLHASERLKETRQAQQALLLQENQAPVSIPTWEGSNCLSQQTSNTEQLETETAELRGKLAQLQSKKKRMDHLVSELQAVELSDGGSCSSEVISELSKFGTIKRDKAAELDVLKAQLTHLKALMEEATRAREPLDSVSEPEAEGDVTIEDGDEAEADNEVVDVSINSFDHQSNADETGHRKIRNSMERPTIEQVQAVTRELKEQSALLQVARAELHRLKQPPTSASVVPPHLLSIPTPPPSLLGLSSSEKKQSNNNSSSNNNNSSGDVQLAQNKRRQMEELMRKEHRRSSSANQDTGGPDWTSRRGSNSQFSHASATANLWPLQTPTAAEESNDQSVYDISSSENLLDIGSQGAAIENGFNGNYWGLPAPPINQSQRGMTGSAEYYRQLLLGSQAQQLQMMGTTMQQCCQLLWAQQRELQSMRSAITQLQLQVRQLQPTLRTSSTENQEEYSNLCRNAHHLGSVLDAALPPSSSLPNLVSLPNSSPAPTHTSAAMSASNPHHHHQQLNNQVPPGNRANNYWDNFRSYSRQNLLSGNTKTMTECSTPVSAANISTPTNTAGSVNSSLAKDKRNREHGPDNLLLPSLSGAEVQYSLNLQLQSNLQQHDREIAVARSNILSNATSQQSQQQQQQPVDTIWEGTHSSFRPLPGSSDDYYSLRHLSCEMRDAFSSLVAANRRRPDYLVIILREIKAISEDHRLRPRLLQSLRTLQSTPSSNKPLNETIDQTASESCQSSDDDSEVGAQASAILNSNIENETSLSELLVPLRAPSLSLPIGQASLMDHFDNTGVFSVENANVTPTVSLTPGYNEDLAEADQSRPETSGNQQVVNDESRNEREEEVGETATNSMGSQPTAGFEAGMESFDREDEEKAEDIILDRIPTRLYHH